MSWSWGSSNNTNQNNNNNSNSANFSWGNNTNNNNNQNNQNNNTSNNNSNNPWSFSANTNNSNTNNNGNTSFSWGSEGKSNNNNNTNNGSFAWNGNNNNNSNNNNNINNNNNSNFAWGSNSNNNSSSNTIINPNNDSLVNDITSDSISCISYHGTKDMFCVGSWDNTITLYEQFGNQTRKLSQQKHDKPVLNCCWNTNTNDSLFSSGCDNAIKMWTPQQNSFITIGQHQSPIRCVKYCNLLNCVISGSWDCNMSFWDIRNPPQTQKVYNNNFGAKIYAMAQRGQKLVVALSNQDIQVFDVRQYQQKFSSLKDEEAAWNSNGNNNSSNKPVSLKRQIRDISIFPDCTGYAGCSIGGRVIIKHFDSYNKKKDFSFKCHRQKATTNNKRNSVEYVFGVNVIKFHDPTGTFITAGDDGEMVVWDKDNRAKLYTFKKMVIPNYNSNNNDSTIKSDLMPIVAADYNHNGTYLCYATSYNWNKGQEFCDRNQQKPTIYLHQVTPKEVEKSKK